MNKQAAAVVVAVALLLGSVGAYHISTVNINTTGVVPTDQKLQLSGYHINWGNTLKPLETVTRMLTVTNTGGQPTEPLNMTHTCTVGEVAWNLEGAVIQPSRMRVAEFTLTVAADPERGDFSFNITITG